MSNVGIIMVGLELVIQWMSAGYALCPISTLLVSTSIFDLVSLRKLSLRASGCANDNTTILGVGHILRSETMST